MNSVRPVRSSVHLRFAIFLRQVRAPIETVSRAAVPSPALRGDLQLMQVVPSTAGAARVVLPTPGLVIGFRVDARGTFSAALSGLRTSVRRMVTPTPGVTVVAAFRPLAAARFFRVPLHELFGQVVPLSSLVPGAMLAEAGEKMAEARDAEEQARVLDAFLVGLRGEPPEDSLVASAVDSICRTRGNLRIDALARALGLSQDRLEKRFRRLVGSSPKQLSSILRFRSAVATSAAGKSLTEVAHETGYADHSHLVRSFRSFTGEAPSRFLKNVSYCGTEG